VQLKLGWKAHRTISAEQLLEYAIEAEKVGSIRIDVRRPFSSLERAGPSVLRVDMVGGRCG